MATEDRRKTAKFCRRACVRLDSRPLEELFWRHVIKAEAADGCWLWSGARHPFGYGIFGTSRHIGKNTHAHRFAWELQNGPIPDGLVACHRCDNPPCCNPEHIFIGTHADNVADKILKGRQPRGEKHFGSTMTEYVVRRLRKDKATMTYRQLSRKYGVSEGAIVSAVLGKSWGHVT